MPVVKRLGRPRETDLRAIIALTGCQRRLLPKDFPPFTIVQGYFYDWRDQGLFERINFELLLQARETAGRNPVPLLASSTANRSRPPKAAEHEAMMRPKKVKGRKRHLVSGTSGLLVSARCTPRAVANTLQSPSTAPWSAGLPVLALSRDRQERCGRLFLAAVAPAEIGAWARARKAQRQSDEALRRAEAQQVDRLRYESIPTTGLSRPSSSGAGRPRSRSSAAPRRRSRGGKPLRRPSPTVSIRKR
jgi:transposase